MTRPAGESRPTALALPTTRAEHLTRMRAVEAHIAVLTQQLKLARAEREYLKCFRGAEDIPDVPELPEESL